MVVRTGRLQRPDGHEIVYDLDPPAIGNRGPGVIFLHGLGSDRKGTKALALEAHCRARGCGFLCFDMYGHGDSSGRFEAAGPGRWRDDAVAVLEALTEGPQVLIGSSMGGWVSLLTAVARPARIAGFIGIAAAPDFTEDLMWPSLTSAQQQQIAADGIVELPGEGDGLVFRLSRHLFDDGRKHLILRAPVALNCPVRLLHGQQDDSVPWQRSLDIAAKVSSRDVVTIFVKDGDHRLSRPQDLALLCRTLDELIAQVS